MKRILLTLCALCLCGVASFAQTPTAVSGTIVDPNGVPYSFAKVSATLVNIPPSQNATILVNGNPTQIGGQSNGAADANGNFSMNLFCNTAGGGCSVISPSGTQWLFNVTTNGEPLPLGTGPQACTATITITGATQSISGNFSCPALGRSGGNGTSGLTQVVQSGLVGEFRTLPTETAAALVDYSGKGNNATGTAGTAPTIVALTGGVNCGGAGGIVLPAGLNSALTVQMFVSYQPSSNANATNTLLQGNGANAISLVLYSSTAADSWGSPIAGGARLRSLSPGNPFKSSSRDVFAGTGVISFLMDTNDRFFIGTQEANYIQQSNSAGLQTNGQYQLCGTTNFATSTIYYVVFYNRVLNTSEIAQNVQFITNAMAARNVASSLFPTDSVNQAVCDGDSLTAGGTTWCTNVGLLTSPSLAVTGISTPSVPTYNVADQGVNGGGSVQAQSTANHSVDPLYRSTASNNADVLWIGTNDNNAVLSFPQIRSYCLARRLVGWKCIVGTMISRTGEDSTKNQLNGLLRAHWSEFADGLADFAANPNLGADGAFSNLTYFSDAIHLTGTGNSLVTAMGKRSVSRAFGNSPSSGTILTAPPQFQFVQGNSSVGASTVAFTSNNVAGNFIFVAILAASGGTTINTPTDTRGNTYTALSAQVNLPQGMRAYFAPNIGAGANTITATFSSGGAAELIAAEYSGVLSAAPLDIAAGIATQGGSTQYTTNSMTTTAAGELVIGYAFGLGNVGSWSVSSNYSLRTNVVNTTSSLITDFLSGAAGSYNTNMFGTVAAAGGMGLAAFKVGTPAGTYAMADQDVYLYCNPSGNPTAVNTIVTLPDAVGLTGQSVFVKNTQATGTNTCTAQTQNSETIDGNGTSYLIPNMTQVEFKGQLVSPSAAGANFITGGNGNDVVQGGCTSSASPAVCGSFQSGAVAVPAASATLVVNTTAIGANSGVWLQEDASLGTRLGVTCNTTPTVQPLALTARANGTSFTFSNTAPTTNPRCVSWRLVVTQ
jgi:hypothetical protein